MSGIYRKLSACVVVVCVVLAGCGGGESSSRPQRSSSVSEAGETGEVVSSQVEPEPADGLEEGGGETPAKQAGDDRPMEPELTEVTLTIPEGYTLARIGMTLEELGICTVEQFIEAAQADVFNGYALVAAQEYDPNRCFNLEGYLFPDTYRVYTTESPDAIIRRILSHFHQVMDQNLLNRIGESGYTVDEILTMASIIEKEAFGAHQMPYISSVLHNRLEIGMKLQCDVTITYVEGAIKPFITGDIDRYNEYYNTFKCNALPAGAICNPGLPAIRAALNPADTDYLFFVTDADKNYYYAVDYDEHLDNMKKAGL